MDNPQIPQLSVQDAKVLIDGDQPVTLLDVREAHEVALCRIANSVHIPMQEIPQHMEKLSTDTSLIVVCHHGGRSQMVAQWLALQGRKRIYNMTGGIDQWSVQIDPAIPRY